MSFLETFKVDIRDAVPIRPNIISNILKEVEKLDQVTNTNHSMIRINGSDKISERCISGDAIIVLFNGNPKTIRLDSVPPECMRMTVQEYIEYKINVKKKRNAKKRNRKKKEVPSP